MTSTTHRSTGAHHTSGRTPSNLLKPIEFPSHVPRPILSMVIDSELDDPNSQIITNYRRMVNILDALGWSGYVYLVDLSECHHAKTHLINISDASSLPYLFFNGKPLGGADYLQRAAYRTASGQSYLRQLMLDYVEWCSTTPRSPSKGCELGVQLRLDRVLESTDLLIPEATGNQDPSIGQGESEGLVVSARNILPSMPSKEAGEEGLSLKRLLPRFQLGNNLGHITFSQLMYELLLKFAYLSVRTNGPDGSATFVSSTPDIRRKTHRRCFRGTELIDFISFTYRIRGDSAREVCQILMDMLVLRQVERKDVQLFNNANFLYRFATHDNPLVLNKLLIFPRRWDHGKVHPMRLIKRLFADLLTLLERHKTHKGYDLRAMYYTQAFMDWRIAICELQHVYSLDPDRDSSACTLHPVSPYRAGKTEDFAFCSPIFGPIAVRNERPENGDCHPPPERPRPSPWGLPPIPTLEGTPEASDSHHANKLIGLRSQDKVPTVYCQCDYDLNVSSDALKKAFFINLYNMGILHSFVQVGTPVAPQLPPSFFYKVGYCLGTYELRLIEIFSDILLLGRVKRCTEDRGLYTDDEFIGKYQLSHLDSRVHFSVHDYVKETSIETIFRPETVESQLESNAIDFCMRDENFHIDVPESVAIKHGLSYGIFGTLTPNAARELTTRRMGPSSVDGAVDGYDDGLEDHILPPGGSGDRETREHKVTFSLSPIFSTYESDFGKSKYDVVHRIVRWLHSPKREFVTTILRLHEERKIGLGVKYRHFQWHHTKLGIGTSGRFPFTEEVRIDRADRAER